MATSDKSTGKPGPPKRLAKTAAPARSDDTTRGSINTEGGTRSTAESSGSSAETTTTTSPDSTPTPDDEVDSEDVDAQPELVVSTEPKRMSKREAERREDLGRVSLITLDQAVTHLQSATGVDRLQRALDLPETGRPDDALIAAIAAYRKDNDLGAGSVDAALLQHLGFEVITV